MAVKPGNPKVTDLDIIQFIKHHDDPVVTASEVAEEFEPTRQAINERLNDLQDQGILDSKSSGSGRVWWVSR